MARVVRLDVAPAPLAEHPLQADLARFAQGWHAVGTLDDIPRRGDFLSCDILGTSVLVRRTSRGVRAFINACAHRHTAITLAPRGNMARVRCPYHGWEYDAEGVACRIPEAGCFRPFTPGEFRLHALACEQIGRLLFVHLERSPQALRSWLGDPTANALAQAFPRQRRIIVSVTTDHEHDWRASLARAYADPLADLSLPTALRWLRALVPAAKSWQDQPNLLLSESRVVRVLRQVLPLGRSRSRSLVIFSLG